MIEKVVEDLEKVLEEIYPLGETLDISDDSGDTEEHGELGSFSGYSETLGKDFYDSGGDKEDTSYVEDDRHPILESFGYMLDGVDKNSDSYNIHADVFKDILEKAVQSYTEMFLYDTVTRPLMPLHQRSVNPLYLNHLN